MNKEIVVWIMLKNIVAIVCFTLLSIAFEKWWIIFFALFFTTTVTVEKTMMKKTTSKFAIL